MRWLVGANILNEPESAVPLRLMKSRAEAKEFHRGFGHYLVRVPTDLGSTLTIGLGRKEAKVGVADWRSKVTMYVLDPGGTSHALKPRQDAPGHERPPSTDADFRLELPITSINRGNGKFYVTIISPDQQYEIYATLVDVGQARDSSKKPLIPWNFWFFPYSPAMNKEATAWAGSTLRPFQKYEEAFGKKGALAWERKFHSDIGSTAERWAGHCDDIARASALFEEPPATLVYNGVEFLSDELKLLAGEVVAQYNLPTKIWSVGDEETKDGPFQRMKPSDAPAAFGALSARGGLLALCYALRANLRDNGRLVVMDLRDPDGTESEAVWNHAVFRYELAVWQPSAADWTFVECELILRANLDVLLLGSADPSVVSPSGLPAIVVEHPGGGYDVELAAHEKRCLRFSFRFTSNGMPENTHDNLWHSVTMTPDEDDAVLLHAPRIAVFTTSLGDDRLPAPLATGNPYIDKVDVLKLLKLRGDP